MMRYSAALQKQKIIKLRNGYTDAARYICGVDACSNEIGCKPEVFAPVFRALKAHRPQPQSGFAPLPHLRITYHVGENFLNVADGLRAIHEAIRENPKLFVSVNTDDQGVFDTSLENEYALLARGLEQVHDAAGERAFSPTAIYGWLDKIREMGLEQSFL